VLSRSCEFETQRLRAVEWHTLEKRREPGFSLPAVVASLLTESVTAVLPEQWHGPFTQERAASWIAEQDTQSTVLLVVEKPEEIPVGLLVLGESDGNSERIQLAIGYLLAEEHWGKGLASELVAGLLAWCLTQLAIASLVARVAPENIASRRVLEKNGFRLDEEGTKTLVFRLELRSR
jgi:RimJ/RimL family protein N-acetyltransferase